MRWNDPSVLDRIEKAVSAVEKTTSAEIVVVLAPQSGSYLDREMLLGVAAGIAALAVLVFAPVDFHPALAFADFLFAFGAATLISNRVWFLRRLVVGPRRTQANVRTSMLVAFHDEGVDSTRERTGVLVYASAFERAIRIHPDLGIEGKIGESAWNEILREAGSPSPSKIGDALVRVIEAAGAALAAKFPPTGDNPDEIPNRPRVMGS
ncbi:MAG: hypothetical protein MUC63_06625 [Planctomycetes bacterium]|jgi:putative membrane protein|nr:hypothetical protein [Planctomycetota bacterium]